MNARKQHDILAARVSALQAKVLAGQGSASVLVDLKRAEDSTATLRPKIASLEAALGRLGDNDLRAVRYKEYFERRMEARVLKIRTRARVIQQKMECTRFERPMRTQANGTSPCQMLSLTIFTSRMFRKALSYTHTKCDCEARTHHQGGRARIQQSL